MKITDVTLTLFTWDGIPAVAYGPDIRIPQGSSTLGLLAIATDDGLTGHAFFGGANRGAQVEGRALIGTRWVRCVQIRAVEVGHLGCELVRYRGRCRVRIMAQLDRIQPVSDGRRCE